MDGYGVPPPTPKQLYGTITKILKLVRSRRSSRFTNLCESHPIPPTQYRIRPNGLAVDWWNSLVSSGERLLHHISSWPPATEPPAGTEPWRNPAGLECWGLEGRQHKYTNWRTPDVLHTFQYLPRPGTMRHMNL